MSHSNRLQVVQHVPKQLLEREKAAGNYGSLLHYILRDIGNNVGYNILKKYGKELKQPDIPEYPPPANGVSQHPAGPQQAVAEYTFAINIFNDEELEAYVHQKIAERDAAEESLRHRIIT